VSAVFEPIGAGRFRVAGDLGFDSVPSIWEASRGALEAAPDAMIDLGGVARVDSAGLALVVEWMHVTAGNGGRLRFTNLPGKLLALARISELEPLLDGTTQPR
jgi:phospholipid transport system transporter-binding protein